MQFNAGGSGSGSGTQMQQQQLPNWMAAAAGLGTGVVADQGYQVVKTMASRAKWGLWLGVGSLILTALVGQGATGPNNVGMAAINSVIGTTWSVDAPAVKSAIQQALVGQQNLNVWQYLGISTSTPPIATPSTAAPAAVTNTTAILLGFGLFAIIAMSDR